MISEQEKTDCKKLASLSGSKIAEYFGCSYDGDSDPIEHGGFFYSTRNWEEYDYANVVEFWRDPEDDDRLCVQQGTIHKPSQQSDWEECWAQLDIPEDDDETRSNIHAQIAVARQHCGIEPAGTSYHNLKTFRCSDWQEWRIWRSINGWLRDLGS